MHRAGHHITGMITGAFIAGLAHNHLGYPLYVAGVAVPAGWYGGVFPDAVEKIGKFYWIEHRTLTHWLPLWVAILIGLFYVDWVSIPWGDIWFLMSLGFVSGALTHLVFDWPNPTGIPIVTPFHRHSLNLWKSGRLDVVITLVWAAGAYHLATASWFGSVLTGTA
ncbi:MAG TPA: metal-dependent hydrolase [Marinobacter sp.]|uniref:Membrane-bound metal-dependent hydrolase n=1 Tax=marine sediment metagenome TaxID=412755 RepID=A0A0F9L7Q0_9ZZZZ|nr:metal-dependent hydrolase [Marinobacter sp.]